MRRKFPALFWGRPISKSNFDFNGRVFPAAAEKFLTKLLDSILTKQLVLRFKEQTNMTNGKRKTLTQDETKAAALAVARRMVTYCMDRDRYGKYATIEAALSAIAGGEICFADICDDNIFIHEGLAALKLIPKRHNPASQANADTWNSVASHLGWAAGEILGQFQKY